MLTTAAQVNAIPGMALMAARPPAWINALIAAADGAVKRWLKRDIELTACDEVHDGSNQPDLVLRQRPVWVGQANLAPASIGITLPQPVIWVDNVLSFHPGTADPTKNPPTVAVQVGINSWSWVTYTGTATDAPGGGPRFTGCTGGSGTMVANPAGSQGVPWSVASPVAFFDPQAMGGQRQQAWGAATQLIMGQGFWVPPDVRGGDSSLLPVGVTAAKRGLMTRGGGSAGPGMSWWPGDWPMGRLAGTRRPGWPISRGSIRVMYSAGYLVVPADISYATAMLVAQMARIQPAGSNLSSESAAWGYSLLADGETPEMGTIRRTLQRWREFTF